MKFDINQLSPLIEAGYIARQSHPRLPLVIHNYTQRCQFDQAWNDLTLVCRGLITDDSGTVIARPFRKFFNLEEHEREGSALPPINWNQGFYVSEKLDGSLGILYASHDGPAISTRGSFISEQALEATDIWRERYATFDPLPGKTYLFEIVYPGNRIVLDYGPLRDLILLEVVDNEQGYGAPRQLIEAEAARIGCPVVPYLAGVDAAALASYETGETDREGIVVRFDDGLRVKIKLAEYKRLHRLLTGINARKVWECLSTGTDVDLDRVPDEFFQWVNETKTKLRSEFTAIERRAAEIFSQARADLGPDAVRKDFALSFMKTRELSGILFSMLDGKEYAAAIWKMIYPEHSPPWKGTGEES
jgi:RNA ligase